jgi:hypothetical protein
LPTFPAHFHDHAYQPENVINTGLGKFAILIFYVCSNLLLVPTKNLIKSIPSVPLSPNFPGLKTSHVNFPPGLSSFGEFALLLFSLQQFPASALSANGRVTTFLDLFSLPQHLKRRICAHRLILNVIVMFVVGALRLLLFFLSAAAESFCLIGNFSSLLPGAK